MTPILKVITEYCSIYVKDDPNILRLAAEDKPLYARQVWGLFKPAIAKFTLPANMQNYLVGTLDCPKIIEPRFDSLQYATKKELTGDTAVKLGKYFVGYELFSCRIRTEDDFGNIIMIPTCIAKYNGEEGTVTFSASKDNPIPAGTIFDMDFYSDGYFKETLSGEVMNILGMCFNVVWHQRNFVNDWLSLIPKVEDKSFSEQNRANKERADTERWAALETELASAMRRYEQNLERRRVLPSGGLV